MMLSILLKKIEFASEPQQNQLEKLFHDKLL